MNIHKNLNYFEIVCEPYGFIKFNFNLEQIFIYTYANGPLKGRGIRIIYLNFRQTENIEVRSQKEIQF